MASASGPFRHLLFKKKKKYSKTEKFNNLLNNNAKKILVMFFTNGFLEFNFFHLQIKEKSSA
jgi:hypothetical protein